MRFSFIFFTVFFLFTAQGMQQIPKGKVIFVSGGVGSNPYDYQQDVCTSLPYEYPTLLEVKQSQLGNAISYGNLEEVRRNFEGFSGLKGWVHWLLMDKKRQWIRAVHGLMHAVEYKSKVTGDIACYLWKQVKKGYRIGNDAVETIVDDQLESKGTCLILNALKNGHDPLVAKLINRVEMQYGVGESVRYAVERNDIELLRSLIDHGAQCHSDILIRAISERKEEAAALLLKNNIGLRWYDQKMGTPLHIALFRNSPLVPLLIKKMPARMINVYTKHFYRDEKKNPHITRWTALDVLLRTKGHSEEIIESLLKRGALCGPGAPSNFIETAVNFRKKFGIPNNEVCLHAKDGTVIDCFNLRIIGW